jgi:hypothetical protein
MFSSSPVAASLIFILLLLNATAHVGNLLPAELSSRGLSCRLDSFTLLSFCLLVFWPSESTGSVSLLHVAVSLGFVLSLLQVKVGRILEPLDQRLEFSSFFLCSAHVFFHVFDEIYVR